MPRTISNSQEALAWMSYLKNPQIADRIDALTEASDSGQYGNA